MKEWLAAICGETWWRKKRERKMRWQAASRYPLPEREQLEQYAAAFFSLADLFQKLPCQKERFGDAELEQLLWQIQETACTGCARGMECWRTNYYKNWDVIFALMDQLEAEGEITAEGIAQLEQVCTLPEDTAKALTQAYMKQRSILLWNNRMMEQRMAAGEEIYQTAVLWRGAGNGRQSEKRGKAFRQNLAGAARTWDGAWQPADHAEGRGRSRGVSCTACEKEDAGLCEDDRRASFRLHGGKNASSLELYGSSG